MLIVVWNVKKYGALEGPTSETPLRSALVFVSCVTVRCLFFVLPVVILSNTYKIVSSAVRTVSSEISLTNPSVSNSCDVCRRRDGCLCARGSQTVPRSQILVPAALIASTC